MGHLGPSGPSDIIYHAPTLSLCSYRLLLGCTLSVYVFRLDLSFAYARRYTGTILARSHMPRHFSIGLMYFDYFSCAGSTNSICNKSPIPPPSLPVGSWARYVIHCS